MRWGISQFCKGRLALQSCPLRVLPSTLVAAAGRSTPSVSLACIDGPAYDRSHARSTALLCTYQPDASSCTYRCTFHDVPGNLAEQLCDALIEGGALSTSTEEQTIAGRPSQGIFAEAKDADRIWKLCSVAGIFEAKAQISMATALASAELQRDLAPEVDELPESDWIGAVEASYVPVQVCDNLWIIPTEHQIQDASACNILMRPGMAFGTGEHPTTQLCLRYLASSDLRGKAVLDYGTGSGILGIAALKLGADSAIATDTQAQAVQAASTNAELNAVSAKFQALRVADDIDLTSLQGQFNEQQFDLCVANILQGPLIELAPLLGPLVKCSGCIAMSGILVSQAAAVRQAYLPYFSAWHMMTEGEWACLIGSNA